MKEKGINRAVIALFFIIFIASTAMAQIDKAVRNIISKKDTATLLQDTAALEVDKLRRELLDAQMDQANMKMELEQMKLKSIVANAEKRARQKARIDSLRKVTPGIPVIVEGDTLFRIYSKRGGYTPQQRAAIDSMAITQLGKQFSLIPDSLTVENSDIVSDLMYRDKVIASFTDSDGLWENCTREELAAKLRVVVVAKLKEMKETHSLWRLAERILYFILVLVAQYFLFRITGWLYRKLKVKIQSLKDTKLKPYKIHDYELLDTQKQTNLLLFFANILRYAFILLQLVFTVPLLFVIFPQTKDLAYTILSYIWSPITDIFGSIMSYIPNLFTILVIYMAIKYLIKLVRYLANEIHSGNLKINGFYPDWAMPTFHIIRFLLYAFMLAMIYPYLPGSKNGVFQGVSVFLGLIVSLGSTAVIGNIIAGMVITYMRPFKLGDRIKLNDTTGNVVEKTPFVTRIRTPKNELVTIPNSFMMSSHTINYSASAREYGLIIHSEVTIGYDAPWRQVHKLLISAALNTPGVQDDPQPFVLETSLSDYYPVYQVNAYIKDADKLAQIYSDLHQNIQDYFNEAGVEIMSPSFMGVRDGNGSTIPKDDMRGDAKKGTY